MLSGLGLLGFRALRGAAASLAYLPHADVVRWQATAGDALERALAA
jgi:hypothetical protein